MPVGIAQITGNDIERTGMGHTFIMSKAHKAFQCGCPNTYASLALDVKRQKLTVSRKSQVTARLRLQQLYNMKRKLHCELYFLQKYAKNLNSSKFSFDFLSKTYAKVTYKQK